MTERILVLLLFFLASAVPARAQEVRSVFTDYSVASWGTDDGLPEGLIGAIIQTAEGDLLLASDGGLIRFDGVRFTRVQKPSLPEVPVQTLLAASDGSVWVGFSDGEVAHLRNDQVTNYGERDGLPPGSVTVLVEDRTGTIWAAGLGGVSRLVKGQWRRWEAGRGLPEGAVSSAYAPGHTGLIVATDAGVFRRDEEEDRFHLLGATASPAGALTEDAKSRVWVTDPLIGVRQLGLEENGAVPLLQGRGSELMVDSKGTLWVGTLGQGLWAVRGDPTSSNPAVYNTGFAGLLGYGVTALLEDRDHNIWVGTFGGLNRLTPRRLVSMTHLGIVSGLDVTPDGSTWVATADELVRFFTRDQQLQSERRKVQVRALHVDERGSLWVATTQELLRFVDGHWSKISWTGSHPRRIEALSSDLQGGLWVYDANDGLLRWTRQRLTPLELPEDLKHVKVASLYTDSHGRLWIAFAMDGRVAMLGQDGTLTSYGAKDGLTAGDYLAIYEDRQGVIWLGASQGLTRFANGRLETVRRPNPDRPPLIRAIIEDEAQGLWLATASGFARLNRREFDKAAATPPHHVPHRLYDSLYDASDGLETLPLWIGGSRRAARASDGRLWFAMATGITVLDPSARREKKMPANVRIEGIVADGTELPPGTQMSLPSRTARLRIDYTMPELTSPRKTIFRYRLEGFDSSWTEAGPQRQAHYTNLPPGQYRFQVVAATPDGEWAEPGAEWAFAIRPMFYETRAFLIAGVLAGLLTAWAIWYLHLRRVRQQFALVMAERVRLSREIHDTLLQSLVGVALQCDALAADVDPSEIPVKNRIVRLRKRVEEYIREARQSIWALRDPASATRDLADALREAGERACDGEPLKFECSVTGASRKLSTRASEQLLRIGQEAVVNAVRHAKATRVAMELQFSENSVRLRVCDDGNGFDPATCDVDGHYGLISMRERAEDLGAHLTVRSAFGQGTDIELAVPTAGQGVEDTP